MEQIIALTYTLLRPISQQAGAASAVGPSTLLRTPRLGAIKFIWGYESKDTSTDEEG